MTTNTTIHCVIPANQSNTWAGCAVWHHAKRPVAGQWALSSVGGGQSLFTLDTFITFSRPMHACRFLSYARKSPIQQFTNIRSAPFVLILKSGLIKDPYLVDSSFYAWFIWIRSGCCHRTMIERPDSAVSSVAVSIFHSFIHSFSSFLGKCIRNTCGSACWILLDTRGGGHIAWLDS